MRNRDVIRAGPSRATTGEASLRRIVTGGGLVMLLAVTGCSLVSRPAPPPAPGPTGGTEPAGPLPDDWFEEGIASWYGTPFHGRQTASGERYDMDAPTAAHQTLPFGTLVEVHNLDNGRSTRLRINDRGPFVGGRIIDVSRHGARELGMLGPGTARVRLAVVESPAPRRCWQVQAGSFSSRTNAVALEARFERDGYPVRVDRVDDDLHRVILGPFDSEAEAHEVAEEVAGLVVDCP